MVESQGRVAGYYLPNQAYVQLQPSQQPYFYYNGQYTLVTPANYQWSARYPDVYTAIYVGNEAEWLPTGTQFYVETPPPPPPPASAVAGYYEGSAYQPLAPGEAAVYYYNGETYPVSTQQDVEYAKNSQCYPGIKDKTGGVRYLAQGTVFYLNPTHDTATATVPNQSYQPSESYDPSRQFYSTTVASAQAADKKPAPMRTSINLPPPPKQPLVPANPPPSTPTAVDQQPTPAPNLSRSAVFSSAVRQVKCRICSTLQTRHIKVRSDIYCLNCALGKLKRNELSSGAAGAQAFWSAGEIYEVYSQLSNMLDEATKAELPTEIALPLESLLCVAYDKLERPGYPPRGHIIGKNAVVAGEEGCPNGHVLCKGCANKLSTCPVCGSFVAYEEVPLGCPAHPGDGAHCAGFDRVCEAPGCQGGKWPKKQRKPEEAKVEEGQAPAPEKTEERKPAND